MSAPPTEKANAYLGNPSSITFPHSVDKQNEFVSLRPSMSSDSPPTTHSLASNTTESPTDQNSSINPAPAENPLVITEAHMSSERPKLYPYHYVASYAPCLPSAAPSCLSREDSAASLLSLEARDSSIRIVRPNLTLSPPHKAKDHVTKKEGEPVKLNTSGKGSDFQATM